MAGIDLRRRVLVLENDVDQLDNYRRRLERAGFAVDVAQGLRQAMDAAERRVFSAAVVDLMLDDPERHDTYDGALLLRVFRELGDGTQAVVVSAQDDTEVAWELHTEYQAFSYLKKSRLVREGLGLLVDRVEKADAAFNAAEVADIDRLYVQLFGRHGQDSFLDESRMTMFFRPRGGPVVFRKEVGLALSEFLPLCAPAQAGSHWTYSDESGGATQAFWSKHTGEAVQVVLSKSELTQRDGALQVRQLKSAWIGVYSASLERDAFDGRVSRELRDLAEGSGE